MATKCIVVWAFDGHGLLPKSARGPFTASPLGKPSNDTEGQSLTSVLVHNLGLI
jgi:hypothetical protein